PLRHILRRQRNLTVLMEEVTAVDLAARRVGCGSRWLDYDWLVIATGATHAYFGHDEWAPFAPALKTLDDAQSIRRRVLLAFEQAEREDDPERRQAWLNFVVVGGGSTGVELAGTLGELARHTLRGEFRHFDSRNASVRLVEAGPRLLAGYDPVLSDKARRQLERLGVEVHTGVPVTMIDAAGVKLGERRLPARTSTRISVCPATPGCSSSAISPACSGRMARRSPAWRRRPSRWASTWPPRSHGDCAAMTARGRHSATATPARWPPSAAWRRSRSSASCRCPGCRRGSSGCWCTSIF